MLLITLTYTSLVTNLARGYERVSVDYLNQVFYNSLAQLNFPHEYFRLIYKTILQSHICRSNLYEKLNDFKMIGKSDINKSET